MRTDPLRPLVVLLALLGMTLLTSPGAQAQIRPKAQSRGPSWSPDGERIIFSSDRDGPFQIYSMDSARGADVRKLTDVEGVHFFYPFYSPDGERIVLMSFESEDKAAIWMMNADGSGLKRMTSENSYNADPHWSPDGRRIVFSSKRDGDEEIYIMRADGSNARRLTDRPGKDATPVISPDGTKIVYASKRGPYHDLWLMDIDGSNARALTKNRDQTLYPCWSPDGNLICYYSVHRLGRDVAPQLKFMSELHTVNVETGEITRLTKTGRFKYHPTYSPDGSRIAFTWNRTRTNEIWVMNADGTQPRRLTRTK